jgi:hypothetical protein
LASPAPVATPRRSRTSSPTTSCSPMRRLSPSTNASTRVSKEDGLGSHCWPGGMSRPHGNLRT